MKIGFFTESYLPQLDGLATSFVGTTAKALEDLGHEVYIIAPRYPGYKDQNKKVYRIASIKIVSSPEIRLAMQIPEKSLYQILKIDFDIIHGFPGLAGVTAVGLQIAKLRNIPKVATCHTFFNHYTHYIPFPFSLLTPKMIGRIFTIIANRFDYVIAPVAKVKSEMINSGVKKPIEVIPVGIHTENYKNIKKGYLRKMIKVSENKKILLYVGRLGEEKSVDFLVHAFKKIQDKESETILVLVGAGPDRKKLQELAKIFHIEKNIFFLGTIPHQDMPKIYIDADIFVFASQTETQGMVIYEAMASGVPVVAVQDDIFRNIIIDGKNGYMVKKNPEIFAQKVLQLLRNQKLYKEFSKHAREEVQKFSIKSVAKRLEELYIRLINEKTNKKIKRKINYLQYFFRT